MGTDRWNAILLLEDASCKLTTGWTNCRSTTASRGRTRPAARASSAPLVGARQRPPPQMEMQRETRHRWRWGSRCARGFAIALARDLAFALGIASARASDCARGCGCDCDCHCAYDIATKTRWSSWRRTQRASRCAQLCRLGWQRACAEGVLQRQRVARVCFCACASSWCTFSIYEPKSYQTGPSRLPLQSARVALCDERVNELLVVHFKRWCCL